MSDLVGNPEDRFSRVAAQMAIHLKIIFTRGRIVDIQLRNLETDHVEIHDADKPGAV